MFLNAEIYFFSVIFTLSCEYVALVSVISYSELHVAK